MTEMKPTRTLTAHYRRTPWLLLLLLIPAILFPHRLWVTLLLGFSALYFIAAQWARSLTNNLHGRRQLNHAWLGVGDQLSEQFTLENNGRFPALWLAIEDNSNIPGYRLRVIHSLPPHGHLRWQQQATCQQRGHFHLGPWQLQASDPFGLFTITITYPQQHKIIIHPPLHRRLPLPLPQGQSHGRSRRSRPHWQANNQIPATRPYQPGDPRRWIHWPTSARQGQLYVRQFNTNTDGHIWIFPDLDQNSHLNPGPNGTEEHVVLLAAALAARALRQQRPVGLALYNNTPQRIPPNLGQGQLWRILRALALLKATSPYPLQQALTDFTRYPQPGASILIITPNLSPSWLPALCELQRHGLPTTLILLDRDTFTNNITTTHQALNFQKELQQLGFNTHLSQQGQTGLPPKQQHLTSKYDATPASTTFKQQ